ncbi:MAG: hypothetical protein AB1324_04720 [Candidatus Micrarchaeota archaeon]
MRLIAIIMIASLLAAGCISGEARHDIKGDGTDNMEVELYKEGLLAGMDCYQFKDFLRSAGENLTQDEMQKIEDLECTETAASLLLKGTARPGEEGSPVSIVKKDGKEYLRYEEDATLIPVVVKMPTPVTGTNGQKIDEKTVRFAPVGMDAFGRGGVPEKNYVESEKPLCPVGLALAALLGGVFLKVQCM